MQLEEIKIAIISILKKKLKKLKKREKNIENDIEKFGNYEEYRMKGDLLKFNLNKIKKGEKQVILNDWETEREIKIELSVIRSPKQNMENYYKKSKKQKKGLRIAEERLAETKKEMDRLKSQIQSVEQSDDIEYLKDTYDKLIPPPPKKKDTKRVKRKIGKTYYYKDHLFFVGRKDIENEELVKYVGGGNDWWFHIKDYRGSHVICIVGKNGEIDFELVKFGATLALANSKAAKSDMEEVIYTQKKNLRKVRDGKPGHYHYTNEKTIRIKKEIDIKKYRYELFYGG